MQALYTIVHKKASRPGLQGTFTKKNPGNRTSARVNFGTRTSAQISKIFINFGTNQFRHKSLTSAHVILLHYAEVNIPMELGAEVNIRCRSPQVGAEVIPCRSHSCRTSISPQNYLFGNRILYLNLKEL